MIGEMKMYPYHNKIKQRIKNGELIGYEYVEQYPRIGKCLVLQFSTEPHTRPIRQHRYAEYVDILVDWNRRNEMEQGERNNGEK